LGKRLDGRVADRTEPIDLMIDDRGFGYLTV